MTKAPPRIAEAARKRVDDALGQIKASYAAIKDGRAGDAETDTSRKAQVYQARTGSLLAEASRMVASPDEGKERKFGKTVDLVDVAFFKRGMRAAHAVARIITRDGIGFGTGFMISPRLLITNNHVIASKAEAAGVLAEFDYERDWSGAPLKVTRYALSSDACFLTNHENDLDYTVVALGDRVSGEKSLEQFRFIPVSNARNKHQLGDFVNLIQHPDGG